MNLIEKLKLIHISYEEALRLILENKMSQAHKVIYSDLGTDLYDLALDILYNNNNYKKTVSKELSEFLDNLKQLIKRVDTVFTGDDQQDIINEEEPLILNSEESDVFIGDIF